jgi:hypothetical protein
MWGNEDIRKMRAGVMDPEGQGMTEAGRICGMIATILSIAGLGLSLVYVVFIYLFLFLGILSSTRMLY